MAPLTYITKPVPVTREIRQAEERPHGREEAPGGASQEDRGRRHRVQQAQAAVGAGASHAHARQEQEEVTPTHAAAPSVT